MEQIFNFLSAHLEAFIEILAACMGFFAVAWTLHKEKKIKKIDFVSTYNFNFLTSNEFIGVEQLLEDYYQHHKRGEINEEYNKQFELNLFGNFDNSAGTSEKHQMVINYLVYLESFTPLIQKEHVKLQDIDNLFGYRYFIAMNNPIVQRRELLPESSYYQNCISIYRQWRKHRRDRHLPIPLDEYDLETSALNFSEYRLSAHLISCRSKSQTSTWIIKDNTGLFTPSLSTESKAETNIVKKCSTLFHKIKYISPKRTMDFCKIKIKGKNITPLPLSFKFEYKKFDFKRLKYHKQSATINFDAKLIKNTLSFPPHKDEKDLKSNSSSCKSNTASPESNKTETSK